MTKREFDRATKRNEVVYVSRLSYRRSRLRGTERDFIADRAWCSAVAGKRVMDRNNDYRRLARARHAQGEPLLFPIGY